MSRNVLTMIAFALLAAAAAPSWSQEYPTRPVKILVPFAAGGPADVYARFLAQRLQDAMGQPFVVEDRPGAGSVTGTDAVAKSPPDGYTLLLMSNAQTVNESLIPNKPYSLLRDFAPVCADQLFGPGSRRASFGPGQFAGRTDPPRQGVPRQAQLCVVGPGHAVPHGRRIVQDDGGRGHRPHSVQGQLGRAHRRARRPGRDDVRCRHDDERVREGRQGAAARDHRQDALRRASERADDGGGRRARLRGGDLAGR